MEGSLEQFDLSEILQVLSIGRQYTGIELLAQDHSRAGTIYIKSGKVLHVKAATLTGKDALVSLFRDRPRFFNVFRVDTPVPAAEPLGSVRSLLLEVWQSSEAPIIEVEADADDEASAQEVTVVGPVPRLDKPPSTSSVLPPAPPPAAAHAKPPATHVARTRSGTYPAVKPAGRSGPPYVIAIASPKGGSGKTTVALNLALSLARQDQRVILVDGDLNGDLLSAIDERASARVGVFDVLLGGARIEDALRNTVHSHLRILPAIGEQFPGPHVTLSDQSARWRVLLQTLATQADIVLVDTPAGMFGVTHQIMSGCTHVIGVHQAEVIATRSFAMFLEGMRQIPDAHRPRVLGVFLNMLQVSQAASVDVLQDLCQKLPRTWLFDTSIPRNTAFLEATAAGVPLRMLHDRHPPAVTWLFDTLAAEVVDRLDLKAHERVLRKRLLA
jgi:chromosome partitioning protein